MKRKNMYFTALLFLLSLVFLPAFSYAAEYRITEQELNQLESNLTQLQQLNEKSQKELSLLKTELKISKTELSKVKQQSIMLQSELTVLKKTSQMQTDLLQGANASLKTYASEEKKKMQAIKNQRNVAYGVGAVLLYALVRK